MSSPVTWNPVRQLWETEQADLFSGQQEPFSETWPTSGMTRSGRLLPLPMSGHRIGGNEYSSLELLHTPDTMPDAPNKGSNTKSKPAGLGNQVSEIALLGTPQAHQGGPTARRRPNGDYNENYLERQIMSLPSAVMNLDELDGLDTVTDTEFLTHPTLTQNLNLE